MELISAVRSLAIIAWYCGPGNNTAKQMIEEVKKGLATAMDVSRGTEGEEDASDGI